jgi:hypothetical protein
MTFASVDGGRAITKARVTIPEYGTWAADVSLSDSSQIPIITTLTIGDLSMSAAVIRMASFSGSKSARLIGGFGGWRKTLARGMYASSGGVRLSTVLQDAATELGERIVVADDRSLGTLYVRQEAPGQRLLRNLIGPVWWIDPSGVTQTGPRSGGDITSQFDVIHWSGGKGSFEIATETYADWMPGRTFTAPTVSTRQVVSMVSLDQDNDGKLRLEVLAEAA